jgi:hypothetical protein
MYQLIQKREELQFQIERNRDTFLVKRGGITERNRDEIFEYRKSSEEQLRNLHEEKETISDLLDEKFENMYDMLETIGQSCRANQKVGRPSDIREIARLQDLIREKQNELNTLAKDLERYELLGRDQDNRVVTHRPIPELGIRQVAPVPLGALL